MSGRNSKLLGRIAVLVLVTWMSPNRIWAVKIADITHLQGSRTNRLVGWGLVVGLNGTGDGKHNPSLSALSQLHKQFANPVGSLDDLKNVKNIAIVSVEATLPRDGVREGDRVDVVVSSVGAAKSLAGGRLLLTPLVGPNPDDTRGVMALAGGPLQIENPNTLTVARIAGGATLERDWIHNYVVLGRDLSIVRQRADVRSLEWLRPDEPYVTFVLDEPHAEWAMAYTVAQAINEEASISDVATAPDNGQIATAFDPRTVIVRIPEAERGNPASFLARMERLQLFMPFSEARVTINRKSGSIVITGDAEISPTIISYKGLTIKTTVPEVPPSKDHPRAVEHEFVRVDPQNKGGARLTDLVEALNLLRVPPDDRITIVEQLHKTGRLHATLKVEE